MDLKRPFAIGKLKWRQGGGGKELVYITARDVMDRLDEATEGYWTSEYKEIKGNLFCGISILLDGEWITKSDGADDSHIEGAKGGISDALKRAAVQYGIGRYLYHPNAFDSNKNPAEWATPEGYDKLMEKRNG